MIKIHILCMWSSKIGTYFGSWWGFFFNNKKVRIVRVGEVEKCLNHSKTSRTSISLCLYRFYILLYFRCRDSVFKVYHNTLWYVLPGFSAVSWFQQWLLNGFCRNSRTRIPFDYRWRRSYLWPNYTETNEGFCLIYLQQKWDFCSSWWSWKSQNAQ